MKTNRKRSKKWIYHKERSFAINYFFFFLKICFSEKTFIQSWFDVLAPQCPYSYFSKALKVFLRVLFPVGILKFNIFNILTVKSFESFKTFHTEKLNLTVFMYIQIMSYQCCIMALENEK